MPAYEVEYICFLSTAQKDRLAEAITQIHCARFAAPALFVNVRFTDIATHDTYVAGKRKNTNRIMAYVRHGPSRTKAMYDDLCAQLNEAWVRIVGNEGNLELRAIFIHGSIVAGLEAGFMLPSAGEDLSWMKENLLQFQHLAQKGDKDFQSLLKEMKTRKEFASVLDEKAML